MRSELERFRPIGRNILTDVIKEEKKTASGLVITDSIKEDLTEYTDKANVLKVGKNVPEVKVDDMVKFNPQSGRAIRFGDTIYLMLTEENIYGVIEPK